MGRVFSPSRIAVSLAFALSLASTGAAAQSLASLLPGLPAASIAELVSGKTAVKSPKQVSGLLYAPVGKEGDSIRAELEADPGSFIIEMGYLIPGAKLSPGNKLSLYKELSRIDTLSGVTYRSYSRGEREVVLLSDVYFVDKPGSKKKLPLSEPASVPELASMNVHAKDANFGSTWYGLDIDSRGSGFLVSLTNTKPQTLVVVRAFGAGDLRLRFAVLPVNEGVYIYSVCAADPGNTAESLVDMFSAAEKRLNAIKGWVVGRVAAGTK